MVKPYVRRDLNVGTEVNDVTPLKVLYPQLEPIPLKKYSYGDVEMILGQYFFLCIHPLEYSGNDRKITPIDVRLGLGWVFSGPLPSTLGFFSTIFKVVTQREIESQLVDQIRSWYDIESYGAYKQVHPRSAADTRAEKIRQETTYHDVSRQHVRMLWVNEQTCLQNNFFLALVQLKCLERLLGSDPILKEQYSLAIRDDLSKGYIVKVGKSTRFMTE